MYTTRSRGVVEVIIIASESMPKKLSNFALNAADPTTWRKSARTAREADETVVSLVIWLVTELINSIVSDRRWCC